MDTVHPLFRNQPPADARLWRYLSFAKFATFLDSSRLHFARVDRFDDHFEGAWPRVDIERWRTATAAQRKKQNFDVPTYTENLRAKVAACCWVESMHESAGMWRLYAPGKEGVAISTTFGKLAKFLENTGMPNRDWLIGAARVRYVDHMNSGLIEEVSADEPLPNTLMPFMLKNVAYENEREVRALVVAGFGNEIPVEGLSVPTDVADLVDDIVVNPFCQPWFHQTVHGIADRYQLKYKVRSSSLSPQLFYIKREEGK